MRILAILTAVLVLTLPTLGWAQAPAAPGGAEIDVDTLTEIDTSASGDQSFKYMRQVFGQALGSAYDDSSPTSQDSLLGAASYVLNLGMIIFVFLVVGWAAAVGLVNTASDGEVLGRQYSTTWLPVRVVMSLALVFPVIGGFSAIQLAVMYFGASGVGLADSAWKATRENLESGYSLNSYVPIDRADELAAGLLASRGCAAVYNSDGDMSGGVIKPIVHTVSKGRIDDAETEPTSYTVGQRFARRINARQTSWRDTCGSWTLTMSQGEVDSRFSQDMLVLSTELHRNYRDAAKQLSDEINAIAVDLVNQANGNTGISVEEAAERYRDSVRAYRQANSGAIGSYRSQIRAQQANEVGEYSSFDVDSYGWIGAGSLYWDFRRISLRHATVMQQEPVVSPPRLEEVVEHRDWDTRYAPIQELLEYLSLDPYGTAGTSVDADGTRTFRVGDASHETFAAKALGGIVSHISRTPIEDEKRPLEGLIDMGQTGVSLITGLLVAMHVAEATAEGAQETIVGRAAQLGGAGIASNLLSKAVAAVTALSLLLLPFLLIIAIYVPFVPYLMWTVGVVGWFIMLLEAVIAAPIWAATHAMPDGAGPISERAKAGYMILLSVFLRPTLMIFGLIAAMLVMELAGHFISITFVPAFSTLVSGGVWFSMIMMIGWTAMLAIILVQTAHRSYALIYEIPDRVLRYIGGSGEVLGEKESEGAVRGGFIAVSRSTQAIRPTTKPPGLPGGDGQPGGGSPAPGGTGGRPSPSGGSPSKSAADYSDNKKAAGD